MAFFFFKINIGISIFSFYALQHLFTLSINRNYKLSAKRNRSRQRERLTCIEFICWIISEAERGLKTKMSTLHFDATFSEPQVKTAELFFQRVFSVVIFWHLEAE